MFEGWSTGNGQWENLANTSTLKILQSNGNVGIKTTGNPTEALEVNGNLKLEGNLMMNGNQKLHIGSYNSNTPTMSDSACVYIGGQHNVTNTLLKIADYDNDNATQKVVHFNSENYDDDYYFKAATNGGYHYYRGYLGIGVTPSSSYRVYADGNAYITGNLGLGGYSSSYKLYVGGNSYLTGNLGLGGYSSSYKLYVNGKTLFNNGVTIQGNSSSTYGLSVSSGIYYNNTASYRSITSSTGTGYIGRNYYYWYYGSYWRPQYTWFNAVLEQAGKISIQSSNAVFASKFIVSSDERIKENIELVPDNLSLSIIRKLEPKYYTYKDKLDKGDRKQVGFMAQDVYKYIPDAVRFTTKVIPNEMKLVSSPIWTTFHDLSGNLKYKLTISDLKEPSGNILYSFKISDSQEANDEVEKQIYSLQNEPNSFVFDKKWNNVFVYGKEVDDFHVLDKAKIWAVAYSALQEVDKIQQNEQTKLKEAESKIKNLENQLASVLSRLATLEKN